MIDTVKNIERFESLINMIDREGKDDLLNFIRKSDFYSAPASTRFHLSCEGGLLQHSLNVYDCLVSKKESIVWKPILEKIEDQSLIVMALLHDICKTHCYIKGTKNQKTYDKEKVEKAENWQVKHDQAGDFIWETVEMYSFDDKVPLGHGEKSVMIIQHYIKLKQEEIFAIRWHMGFSEDASNYNALGAAMEKFPVVLALYEADLEATKILEIDE